MEKITVIREKDRGMVELIGVPEHRRGELSRVALAIGAERVEYAGNDRCATIVFTFAGGKSITSMGLATFRVSE